MRISLEWISDFLALPGDLTPRQLAHDLTLKTVEVEEVQLVEGDVIFEIDNKSLTNRPDLWGHYGIAREFAAIYGLELTPLSPAPRPPHVEGLVGEVDAALCDRFAAVRFTVGNDVSAPELVRRRLARIGEASINLCVDLSNYVMFTVGQPNHVWDADLIELPLQAGFDSSRGALPMVASSDIKLVDDTPVIRDGRGVVGIAGIMGGASSSVHPTSTRFVLEVATFRPRPIRRSSQRLGLRTESSTRYEKGLDTQRVDVAIDLFLNLLAQAAPDAAATEMQDVQLRPTRPGNVTAPRSFLDARIGERLDSREISGTLDALGFRAVVDDESVMVTVPTWRSTGDVALPHDVLEELARIHGYDRLPSATVPVVLRPVRSLHCSSVDRSIREQLALRGGLQEVITYPWTADHLLAAGGYSKDETIRFEGATSPDRNSLRPTLLPNLLETIAANQRYRPGFQVFELGTVFPPGAWKPYRDRYETLPPLVKALGLALVANAPGEILFRQAKGILEMVRRFAFLLDLTIDGPADASWADPSARVAIRVGVEQVGTLALLKRRVLRAAGIEGVQVAYAELDLTPVTAHRSRDNRFGPLPVLPESTFDLSVVLADEVIWGPLQDAVTKMDPLIRSIDYLGEYRSANLPPSHRSLSLRITLQPRDATLGSEDILRCRTSVLSLLEKEFGAILR